MDIQLFNIYINDYRLSGSNPAGCLGFFRILPEFQEAGDYHHHNPGAQRHCEAACVAVACSELETV
jgi:hypothetical protein